MNRKIFGQAERKSVWILAVIILATSLFWSFWTQKRYGKNYLSESQNLNQEEPQEELTEEEIERQKMDKMYAMMGQGYVWAIQGQIKSIDAGKGIMEVETEQTQKKKTFKVLLDGKTEVAKITYTEVFDSENDSSKDEEAVFEVKEDQTKSDVSALQPGMFVQVKAPEMFLFEEEDSIKAVWVTFSQE